MNELLCLKSFIILKKIRIEYFFYNYVPYGTVKRGDLKTKKRLIFWGLWMFRPDPIFLWKPGRIRIRLYFENHLTPWDSDLFFTPRVWILIFPLFAERIRIEKNEEKNIKNECICKLVFNVHHIMLWYFDPVRKWRNMS